MPRRKQSSTGPSTRPTRRVMGTVKINASPRHHTMERTLIVLLTIGVVVLGLMMGRVIPGMPTPPVEEPPVEEPPVDEPPDDEAPDDEAPDDEAPDDEPFEEISDEKIAMIVGLSFSGVFVLTGTILVIVMKKNPEYFNERRKRILFTFGTAALLFVVGSLIEHLVPREVGDFRKSLYRFFYAASIGVVVLFLGWLYLDRAGYYTQLKEFYLSGAETVENLTYMKETVDNKVQEILQYKREIDARIESLTNIPAEAKRALQEQADAATEKALEMGGKARTALLGTLAASIAPGLVDQDHHTWIYDEEEEAGGVLGNVEEEAGGVLDDVEEKTGSWWSSFF